LGKLASEARKRKVKEGNLYCLFVLSAKTDRAYGFEGGRNEARNDKKKVAQERGGGIRGGRDHFTRIAGCSRKTSA